MTWTVSKNAKYLAYTVSKGGSDWQDAHVMEIDGSKPLDDHLQWLKATRTCVGRERVLLQPFSSARGRPGALSKKRVSHRLLSPPGRPAGPATNSSIQTKLMHSDSTL